MLVFFVKRFAMLCTNQCDTVCCVLTKMNSGLEVEKLYVIKIINVPCFLFKVDTVFGYYFIHVCILYDLKYV